MRKILFRGKRLDNGEWVSSGNLITFNDEGDGIMFFIPELNSKCTCTHDEQDNILSFNSGTFYKVATETVGQFTGLTDKKGKQIFEGDVLKRTNGNKYLWYVDFKLSAFCANQTNCNYACELAELLQTIEVEIIGNIHDNPELLEVTGNDG